MKSIQLCFITLVIPVVLISQNDWPPEEFNIGTTTYDLQTYRTMQNRHFVFDDGTMGAVWNMGFNAPGFSDLGIGYNYFDGNSWQIEPTQSITSGWAVFPSYTQYGENGEICVSQGQNGLYVSVRINKGTGAWQETTIPGTDLRHPVVVTTGIDHHIVHLLYLKTDLTFTPTPAQPGRGFIWYARSSDGMQTWEINQPVEGLGPEFYLGFTVGSYSWAEPNGNTLAFVAGDYLTDLVLMKSPDGGDSWQKTIIWNHPYPMFEIFTFDSDTFYCNGGSMSVVLDSDNIAHVAFALSRVFSSTLQDTIWYDPYADGIVYWRGDMPTFINTMNSLHPDSLSVCENLIAWSQDINGNGQLNLFPPGQYSSLGLSFMPNLVISDWGEIFLIFSSATETYNNSQENLRHLWLRAGNVGSCSWYEDFIDLTSDLLHVFDECVYPSAASRIDDNLYLIYQYDVIPGSAITGGNSYGDNYINSMKLNLAWSKGLQKEKGVYVDFNVKPDSIFEGDTVQFRNLSCGCPYPVLYTWMFEGGDPTGSNEQDPEVVYFSPGIYDVSLSADNGQTSGYLLKPDFITVYPLTSITEAGKLPDYSLYPNPASGMLMLEPGESPVNSVKLFNLLGRCVIHLEVVPAKITEMDLSHLSKGIYLLELVQGSQVFTEKIMIK